MKRQGLVLALAVASVCSVALAQTPGEAAAPTKWPRVLHVPPIEVPPELASRGIQGDPVLKGMVQPDGTITDIEVVTSSRSAELDEAAKDILRQVTFEPVVIDGVKVAAPYENTIALDKDHVATLSKKTCADLNVDVAYFQSAFPELETKKMRLATLSLGVYTLGYQGVKTREWIKAATGSFDKTVAWCAAHPNDLYLSTFMKLAK